MNDVERMRIELSALAKVVRDIQVFFEPYQLRYQDVHQAAELARDAGLNISVVLDKTWPPQERGRMLRAVCVRLRKEGWTAARIARALDCSERTVERHLSGQKTE